MKAVKKKFPASERQRRISQGIIRAAHKRRKAKKLTDEKLAVRLRAAFYDGNCIEWSNSAYQIEWLRTARQARRLHKEGKL